MLACPWRFRSIGVLRSARERIPFPSLCILPVVHSSLCILSRLHLPDWSKTRCSLVHKIASSFVIIKQKLHSPQNDWHYHLLSLLLLNWRPRRNIIPYTNKQLCLESRFSKIIITHFEIVDNLKVKYLIQKNILFANCVTLLLDNLMTRY